MNSLMTGWRQSQCRWMICVFLIIWSATALAREATPLKICLISGSAEYESDKSLTELQSYLEGHYQIVCQRAFGKDKGNDLPGVEALDTADLMIVFARRLTLPESQLAHVRKYIASGRPILGLRTASHAFENYKEFDREVLGGGYIGHYGDGKVAVQLVSNQVDHAVLAGVKTFESYRLYKNPSLADDVTVLMTGKNSEGSEPVAWVREHKGARIFYTSLGVPEDFAQESFRRLVLNAVFWTTQRDEASMRRQSTPNLEAIFNGRNLDGWKTGASDEFWKVNEGVLVGENNGELKGNMLYTERTYKNFVLETDVRWSGEIDSGIMFRLPELQLQFGVSRSLKKDMTCSFYTNGKEKYPEAGHAKSIDKFFNPDKWNKVRLEVKDDVYTVWLNGEKVSQYTDGRFKDAGPIGLQIHPGLKMKVEFRNLRVAEIGD